MTDSEDVLLSERIDRLVVAANSLAATIDHTHSIAGEAVRLLVAAGRPAMVESASTPDFVSLPEAARRTGRHPDVLRRWCVQGRVPAIRIGRTWAISRETVAALASHGARSRPRLELLAPDQPDDRLKIRTP